MPATLSILINVFRDPVERGRAIAIWAGFSGLGVAIGPITGGFLLEHFSWSSVFWVNIPIGITALLLGAFLVPTSRDPNQGRIDPLGALLSFVGLASLLFGIIEGPSKGWTDSLVVGAFVLSVVTLVAFLAWELHTPHPMLDLTVFKNPRFSAGSGTITIVFFAMFGSMLLMTQYWQLVHGYSPLEAGIRLLPYAATMMVVAPLSARFVERLGTKRVVLIGLSLVIAGLLLLSTIAADSPYPMVIAFFMVMAAGMGMTMAPATEAVMGSLPRAKAGIGSAINDTTRQVGGALGVAVIGTIVSSVYSARIVDLSPLFGLSAPQAAQAESSLGAAQNLAGSLGNQADSFAVAAGDAFVDALSIGLRIGALAVAVAVVIAWKFLPSHAAEPAFDVIDLPATDVATDPSADTPLAPTPVAGD
jgi:EmrB/QacA subfamily drug resistance transporter